MDMERGGRGSGERRRNATVTMITAARLTRAPGARRMRLTWLHHCPSVTPQPQSLRTNMADDEDIPCVCFKTRDFGR